MILQSSEMGLLFFQGDFHLAVFSAAFWSQLFQARFRTIIAVAEHKSLQDLASSMSASSMNAITPTPPIPPIPPTPPTQWVA